LLGRAFAQGTNPFEAKKQIAFEIVQTYHSPAAAQQTLNEWNIRFSKRDLERADLPPFSANALQTAELVTVVCSAYREAFNAQKSRSEASRLIKQGSVELDGSKIREPKAKVALKPGQILRLDKKHAVRIA
jgi:tyrosyl-tRNA synthetase